VKRCFTLYTLNMALPSHRIEKGVDRYFLRKGLEKDLTGSVHHVKLINTTMWELILRGSASHNRWVG
jgi:hypothetical protein